MSFLAVFMIFYCIMVAANGAEILYPNNFWGLIFWCIFGTLCFSVFLFDDKDAKEKHILTPAEEAEQKRNLFCDTEVLRLSGPVNFTYYLQSHHRLPKEINSKCLEKITYKRIGNRLVAKIPGSIGDKASSDK